MDGLARQKKEHFEPESSAQRALLDPSRDETQDRDRLIGQMTAPTPELRPQFAQGAKLNAP
jgi:hypothetical protein